MKISQEQTLEEAKALWREKGIDLATVEILSQKLWRTLAPIYRNMDANRDGEVEVETEDSFALSPDYDALRESNAKSIEDYFAAESDCLEHYNLYRDRDGRIRLLWNDTRRRADAERLATSPEQETEREAIQAEMADIASQTIHQTFRPLWHALGGLEEGHAALELVLIVHLLHRRTPALPEALNRGDHVDARWAHLYPILETMGLTDDERRVAAKELGVRLDQVVHEMGHDAVARFERELADWIGKEKPHTLGDMVLHFTATGGIIDQCYSDHSPISQSLNEAIYQANRCAREELVPVVRRTRARLLEAFQEAGAHVAHNPYVLLSLYPPRSKAQYELYARYLGLPSQKGEEAVLWVEALQAGKVPTAVVQEGVWKRLAILAAAKTEFEREERYEQIKMSIYPIIVYALSWGSTMVLSKEPVFAGAVANTGAVAVAGLVGVQDASRELAKAMIAEGLHRADSALVSEAEAELAKDKMVAASVAAVANLALAHGSAVLLNEHAIASGVAETIAFAGKGSVVSTTEGAKAWLANLGTGALVSGIENTIGATLDLRTFLPEYVGEDSVERGLHAGTTLVLSFVLGSGAHAGFKATGAGFGYGMEKVLQKFIQGDARLELKIVVEADGPPTVTASIDGKMVEDIQVVPLPSNDGPQWALRIKDRLIPIEPTQIEKLAPPAPSHLLYPDNGMAKKARQGSGDCYLLAGLQGLKELPLAFTPVLDNQVRRIKGGWEVTFVQYTPESGQSRHGPYRVLVKDEDLNGHGQKANLPNGAEEVKKPVQGDLGDRLLEQAYGQLRREQEPKLYRNKGSLEAVEGGFGHRFVEDLTGWQRRVISSGDSPHLAEGSLFYGTEKRSGKNAFAFADRAIQGDIEGILKQKARVPETLVLTVNTPPLVRPYFKTVKDGEGGVERTVFYMDAAWRFPCKHAYTVSKVELDEDGMIKSVTLFNPSGKLEAVNFEEFKRLFNQLTLNRVPVD